jgi:drug/metabolite transporter (DMT)-like permease
MNNPNGANEAPVSFIAGLLLVLVCFLWGANSVSIKISNEGIPPLMAASIRSVVAAFLLAFYARYKGETVFFPVGHRKHGIVIGLLFGLDFFFLYWGIAFTTASRSVIFLYTHPFWVALGAHFVLKGDRFTVTKGFGLFTAFAGVLAVFAARSGELPENYWIGDLMEVAAAVFWAATTLYIKKTIQHRAVSHYQTLFAQLLFSFPVLATGSLLFERSHDLEPSIIVMGAFFYQCFVVAFFSYLLWFWLIHRFPVSKLAAFTFMAPLFGVVLGAGILGESVTSLVWLGMALVGAGIYLVNRPARVVSPKAHQSS